ncbi:acyl-CoA dehydrogenase family protein [Amycolatopsis samaneae]|uniref:Acyl-CoA dehydrogenase family protein n=1 Tax=Amycolatopsis samaneae TaxID=664691 RepID=A0ABW5GFJ2_9PSEU
MTSVFAELSTDDVVAAPADSAPGLWRAVAAALPAPEATTGELAAVARDAGYHATPGPVAETLLVARPVLTAAGLPVPDGPLSYATGDLRVSYAHPDPESRVGPFGAAGTDHTLRVSGTLHRVPWARMCSEIVVVGDAPFGPVAFLLDPGDATLRPGGNLAGEPRDTLALTDVEIPAHRVRATSRALSAETALRAALARAVLIAGAAQRCAELTIQHTATREQFGRPLRHFQAVKQEEAKLIEETALLRAAVDAAVTGLGTSRAEFTVAAAKAQASDSIAEITRIAHQLHGAIGFTELSSLRFVTTRLWSWRDEDGSEQHWSQRLGRQVLGTDADRLWPLVTATT